MTPFELEIALHYHTRCCDVWLDEHGGMHIMTPLLEQTLQRFVEEGLLVQTEKPTERMKFLPTGKLNAFCTLLQTIPLPVLRYVDERTGELIDKKNPEAIATGLTL